MEHFPPIYTPYKDLFSISLDIEAKKRLLCTALSKYAQLGTPKNAGIPEQSLSADKISNSTSEASHPTPLGPSQPTRKQ